MTYSYTQINRYLTCPRQYRYQYLDGWRERETRAALAFGRCFEKALSTYFLGEDSAAAFFREWETFREVPITYANGDTWDRLARQGIHLLELFARDDRVQVRRPQRNLQVKKVRPIANGSEFVAYLDAIGHLDRARCLIEWKTTGGRYPEEPAGLLALDRQLICYSWMSGIPDVAIVAFVRKRTPEIQYLRATIGDDQRQQFGQLVEGIVREIEAGQFPSHSGIRFPQNGCLSCACQGLCLNRQDLVAAKLIRQPGASDLDWIDQLEE